MSSSLSEDQIVNQIISRVYQFLIELRADNNNLSHGDGNGSDSLAGNALQTMTGIFEDGLSSNQQQSLLSSNNNNSSSNEIVAGSSVAAQDTLSRRIVNSTATRDFVPLAPNSRFSLPHHEANLQMFSLGAVKIAKAEPNKVQAAWNSASKAASSAVAGLDGLYKNTCLSAPSLWPVILPDAKGQETQNLSFPFASPNSGEKIGKGLFLRSDDAFNQIVAPAVAASCNISVTDIHRLLSSPPSGSNDATSFYARSILERVAWDMSVDEKSNSKATVETVANALNSFKAVLGSDSAVDVAAAAIAAEAALRRFLSTPEGPNIRPVNEVRKVVGDFMESARESFEKFSLSSLKKEDNSASANSSPPKVAPLTWMLQVRAHQPTVVESDDKKKEGSGDAAATPAAPAAESSSNNTNNNDEEQQEASPQRARELRERERRKKNLKKKSPPEKPWRLPLRLPPGFKCNIYIEEGQPHTSENSEAFVVGTSMYSDSKVVPVPRQKATSEEKCLSIVGGNTEDSYIFGRGDAIRIKIEMTPQCTALPKSFSEKDVAIACSKFFMTCTELLTLSHPTVCNVGQSDGSNSVSSASTTEEKKPDEDEAAQKKEEAATAAAEDAAPSASKTAISALRADPVFALGLNNNSSKSTIPAQLEDAANKMKMQMLFMRAQCQQSWRPLLQKLIAVVLHCGAAFTDSTFQFVAQKWVPDWNLPLQGEVNITGRQKLEALLDFILEKVQQNNTASVHPSAVLSHLKSIFFQNDHWEIKDIESELQARSQFAFATATALSNLNQLLIKTTNDVETSKQLGRAVSLNLLRWIGRANQHYILNAFGGCQSEAAALVRKNVASIIEQIFVSSSSSNINGELSPALLALTSTPTFDSDDAKTFSQTATKTCALLKDTVEKSGAASAANAKNSDLGAACRLVQLCPAAQPEMNTNALGVTVGSSSVGVSINRTSMGALCLRSSCAWPVGGDSLTQCPDGVRYCEFSFGQTKGNILRALIGICDANTKFQDFDTSKSEIEGGVVGQMSLDTKVHDAKGKLAVPFGYENDVVGVGVDLRTGCVFYTLNGSFMFKKEIPVPVDHAAATADDNFGASQNRAKSKTIEKKEEKKKTVRKDYHPFLLYETRDRTNVNANFGQSPFVFDIVQYRVSTLPDEVLSGFEGDLAARCVLHSSVASLVNDDAKMNSSLCSAAGRSLGVLTNALPSLAGLRTAMLATQMLFRVIKVTKTNPTVAENAEFKNLQSGTLSSLRMLCKNQSVGESVRALAWRAVQTLISEAPDALDPSQISKALVENLKISIEEQQNEQQRKEQQQEKDTAAKKVAASTGAAANKSDASSSSSTVCYNDYLPSWTEAEESVANLNGPRITVDPRPDEDMDEDDDQRMAGVPAIAVGSVLPDGADVVSFRVYFHRPALQSATGHSSRMATGGCFIGVTSQNLSSIQNMNDWKTADPPCVWAMHDSASFQLPHADIATVMSDSITFMAGSTLTVTIRRSAGTVSFSRGGHETTLFRHVDPSVQLRPFVLLIGKDSYAQLLPGSMSPIVTPQKVLNGALNRTLFELLRRLKKDSEKKEAYDNLISSVTEMVSSDLKSSKWSENERALTLLGVLPRSSTANLVVPSGHGSTALIAGEIITIFNNLAVISVTDPDREKDSTQNKDAAAAAAMFGLASNKDDNAVSALDLNQDALIGLVEQRQINTVRTSSLASKGALAGFNKSNNANADNNNTAGVSASMSAVYGLDDEEDEDLSDAAILNQICKPLATDIAQSIIRWCGALQIASTLREEELRLRDALFLEEAQSRESLLSTDRTRKVDLILEKSHTAAMPLLQPPNRPASFTFHPDRCSSHVSIPDHYRGALMVCPSTVYDRGPHVAVSREAIGQYGVSSFRVRVMAEWSSLIPASMPWAKFGPGCYVGLCVENYNGTPRYLPAETDPSVWALSFFDTPKLHLKHSCAFPTNLALVRNGDTLRFVIDREKGTMEAFRTPQTGSRERSIERTLGVIYDNIPKDVMLFPFVQLMSARNAALFLPLNETLPRPTTTCTRVAPMVGNAVRSVSGSSDLRCIVCLSQFVDNPLSPPSWYHCVECADIDLCQACFNSHAHCGHEFVQMRGTGFLENRSEITDAATIPAVNTEIEISPVAANLRRSLNCIPVEGKFETAVSSLRGKDSFCASWTLLRRRQAQATFEVSVDFDSPTLLPPNGVMYIGLVKNSCVHDLNADQLHDYLAKVALEPVQRDGVILASEPSLFVWPEHAVGQASSAGIYGSVLDFSVYLSFFLEQDGTVQVQTNGSQLFKVRRELWQGEKFSLVVSVKNIDKDTPVTCSLHSGLDDVPMIARVMERSKEIGTLRAVVGGSGRVTLPGSSARESYISVKNRGQLRVGDKAIHVDSCIDKASPVVICALSATSEGCTVHDGYKEYDVDMRCLLIPSSQAIREDAKGADNDLFPFPEERDRLVTYYEKYAPDRKIEDIEKAIMAYSNNKGGFPQMWKDLTKKYGPEPEQQRPRLQPAATRDLVVNSAELLRMLSSLRLLSCGDNMISMLPSEVQNGLQKSVLSTIRVLSREQNSNKAAAAAAVGSDPIYLLSLALQHAPSLHVATDRSLKAEEEKASSEKTAVVQSDASSEWFNLRNPDDVKNLPLALNSVPAMKILDGDDCVESSNWHGSLLVDTGLYSVFNVNFKTKKAQVTVSVGASATFEVSDIIRSRNTRSIQFLLSVDPAADESTQLVAKRLNSLTMVYHPTSHRMLCPSKDSKNRTVTMMCNLCVGKDGRFVGDAVLTGGAEAEVELSVEGRTNNNNNASLSSTGGALPGMDFADAFIDIDRQSRANSAYNNSKKKKQNNNNKQRTNTVDSQISRVALSSALNELTDIARAFVKSNSSQLLLSAPELFQLLVVTRGASDSLQLLTLSGFATNEDRLSDLLGVAAKSVFELSNTRAQGVDFADDIERVSRAVAAARVIRFAATNGVLADKIKNVDYNGNGSYFWQSLLTALRALHIGVLSTSATRECVSTVRLFALSAFKKNKALAQFLFGPIILFARRHYEFGSALGIILGSTRALVDLIASLVSQANEERAVTDLVRDKMLQLSTSQLPVEQLAFLADTARSISNRSAWPSVAALENNASDTVDSNTIKQNGDGVAWTLVEPRKTKIDLENQSGNRFGSKDQNSRLEGANLFSGSVISNMVPFDRNNAANCRPVYYECTMPPESVRISIGWTTKTAGELAGLRRTQLVREIHSPDTIIFDGSAIYHNGSYTEHGWAGTSEFDVCGSQVQLSEDKKKVMIRWSINGEFFPEVELPEKMRGKPLRAFVQISRSDLGMRLAASAEQCRFTPMGFSNLVKSEQAAIDYDSQKRRVAASGAGGQQEKQASIEEFETAAKELGEFLEEAEKAANPVVASSPDKKGASSAATAAPPQPQNLTKQIKHANEILVVQRCLSRCVDAMDLEGNISATAKPSSSSSEEQGSTPAAAAASSSPTTDNFSAISVLKRIVTPAYRRNQLAVLQPLINREAKRYELPPCAVRWFLLFSHQPRTPADALHHSILAQIKRQLAPAQFLHTPMFSTSLQMTDNGHTPIDAGGPYNQVWSLLGEELSTEGETPRTPVPGFENGSGSLRFYRNPLFRTVNSARGKVLVPEKSRNTPNDLAHFKFLGQIFGHLARAKAPLPVELSLIVWKYIVTDEITIEDFYAHVEGSWKGYIEDEEFISMGDSKTDPMAAELLQYFPTFFEELAKLQSLGMNINEEASGMPGAHNAPPPASASLRRKAAENCVLNSITAQMDAIRSGVWEILGRRTVCAMTAGDLEIAVCGDPNPSLEQLMASVQCQLDTHEAAVFWAAMKQLTPTEWSDFFFFCAAQRRFPLSKKISVVPMSGATDKHMPMASTCFNLLKMPPYKSDVQCLEKLRQAIMVKVMELA